MSDDAQPFARFAGVTKQYGATRIGPVTLDVPAGRTLVFIGPSGCGKSTLLRMLVGLVAPDGGEVRVTGAPVRPESVAAVRARIGYVIQEGGLFPHLTARGNVELAALGWPADRLAARVDELVRVTRFPTEALRRFPSQLSGGQRQRVALMRALVRDPDALLLDEPLGALDPMVRAELQVDLKALFAALGKTVVMVTHDLGEAGFLGDRIVLFRDGRVLQQGSIETLIRAPADPFVTAFVRAQTYRLPLPEGGL